jgi:hypothetical protein
MQSVMNLKIKFRESFRPFAPIVLGDRAHEYFDLKPGEESPYMLLVASGPRGQAGLQPAAPAARAWTGSARSAPSCPRSRTSTIPPGSRRWTAGETRGCTPSLRRSPA